MDFAILDFIQTCHNDVFTFIMKWLTYAGNHGYLWIGLCIVLFCIPKTRKIGVYLAVTLVIAFLLNDRVMKPLVARDRPFIQRPEIDTIISRPSGFSFPSGHSASSFATAMALFLQNKKWGIGALVIASGVAFSRLYFAVHFPTDVICGSLFGILIAIAVNLIGKRIEKYLAERKRVKEE